MRALVVSAQMASQIVTLNAGLRGRQIIPAIDENGIAFLNADILTDCDRGQTWREFRAVLPKAEIYEVEAATPGLEKSVRVSVKTDAIEAAKLVEKFADVIAVREVVGKLP